MGGGGGGSAHVYVAKKCMSPVKFKKWAMPHVLCHATVLNLVVQTHVKSSIPCSVEFTIKLPIACRCPSVSL